VALVHFLLYSMLVCCSYFHLTLSHCRMRGIISIGTFHTIMKDSMSADVDSAFILTRQSCLWAILVRLRSVNLDNKVPWTFMSLSWRRGTCIRWTVELSIKAEQLKPVGWKAGRAFWNRIEIQTINNITAVLHEIHGIPRDLGRDLQARHKLPYKNMQHPTHATTAAPSNIFDVEGQDRHVPWSRW